MCVGYFDFESSFESQFGKAILDSRWTFRCPLIKICKASTNLKEFILRGSSLISERALETFIHSQAFLNLELDGNPFQGDGILKAILTSPHKHLLETLSLDWFRFTPDFLDYFLQEASQYSLKRVKMDFARLPF